MEIQNTPQDDICTHKGIKKAVYTTNKKGEYEITPSTGWSVEELVTMQAVGEFRRLELEAFAKWKAYKTSSLEACMYQKRMTVGTLSQVVGLWQWRVKRHFDYKVFKNLNDKIIARYCEALDMTKEELLNPKLQCETN
jgi:hypothetical protein